MATVYILYSDSINKFYIGSCLDLENRIKQHNNHSFNDSYTKRASDWILFFTISNLQHQQARQVERHIKSMKSRIYIRNLKKYPEIASKIYCGFMPIAIGTRPGY